MDKIENYVSRFFKRNKMNMRYSMRIHEVKAFVQAFKEKQVDAIVAAFNFGYAKGYRAALAEMKKGGAA